MQPKTLYRLSILYLFLFLNCSHKTEDLYYYTGYDSLGVKIIQGSLSFEYIDTVQVSGGWEFDKLGSPQNIGPQTGKGYLLGTRQQDQLSLNLNPNWVDNNVTLTGVDAGDSLTGTWTYSGFAGVINYGTFIAKP